MAEAFYRVKEGEFVRQLETTTITKVIAQESIDEPLKFVVVAINSATKMAYAMRHGRVDELRTWRLDNLARFLKKHAVASFETQFQR
ncbi:hypothetical protein [Aliiglaciecola sp. M165]|uniref:hypothetical protein n=1 Tax=Aliiglaciecola sp. M165 TaxID=2593649 RepID=UPI001180ADC0|nr:hypothetical protein [Aliiglaciecola sp. M165]TRY29796.1 hypothetical protein FM019_16630 [Aliiglaciecola sp. M165]